MKGLLVKDFEFLKLQKKFFFVIVAIAIGLAIMNGSATFMLSYLSFVMPMFTLSTISYDEFDNGNTFLFTLPISRKGYVTEKYVFSLLLSVGSWVLSIFFAVIFSAVKGTTPILEVVITAAIIFPIMIMIQAVMIPIQLRFGGEKGRIAMVGAVGILFIIGFLIVKTAEMLGLELANVINDLFIARIGIYVAGAIAVAVILFLISMNVSNSIMNRKEF